MSDLTARSLAGDARRRLLEAIRDVDDWLYEGARRTRILFVFPDPYGFACQAPVIQKLQGFPDVEVRVAWDRSNARAGGAFASAADEALYRSLRIEPFQASLRKWHLVVYSHLCSFYARRRALRAYLHHGAGFGSGGGLYAAEAFEIYLGLSEAERSFLESRSPGLFNHSRAFFPVGFPKADAVVNGAFRRDEILSKLSLPERRTILITSHYRQTGTLRALGAGIFTEIAGSFPDCNVIQTGHPWLWQETNASDRQWRERLNAELNAIAARYPNARLVTDMLAEPLAAAADLLISDESSVVTTFGLLNKPIVLFANPIVERQGRPALHLYWDAAHAFSELRDAVQACRAALQDPGAKAAGRKVLRDAFYANAGRSAEVTAEVLHRIGAVCSVRSRRWARVLALSASYRT